MDPVTALLLACLLAALFVLWRSRGTSSGTSSLPLPPGPSSLLVFWDLVYHRRDYLRLQRMVPYKDLCLSSFAGQPLVILNSYRAIHEAFVGQAEVFAGRPLLPYFDLVTRKSGIIFTDGPVWQEHRRQTIRLLRDFGVGRSDAEAIVNEECAAVKERLEANGSQTGVNCRKLFTAAINNVIAQLTFGERCGTEDPNFEGFVRNMEGTFRFEYIDLIPHVFPFIVRIPWLLRLIERVSHWRRKCDEMHDYILQKIREHQEQLKLEDMASLEATNICDAYLIEKDRQETLNPGEHTYSEWQLMRTMIELFLAGTETTATSLTWAALMLSLNPEVQKAAQKEVLDKIGRNRAPQMTDRPRTPYLCALMDEVLRYSSLVAANVSHRTIADTELLGYFIPANSMVNTNLYHLHHDPEIWERPEEFYPGHFLTPEGSYKPSKYLLAFSLGKRACLGESLARMELYLMLATILQNFEMKLEDPAADIEAIMRGQVGTLRCPLPHSIVFSKFSDD